MTAPLVTAQATLHERVTWVLAVEDDEGRIGLGEAAPLPDFGSETPERCRAVLTSMLAALDGEFLRAWLRRGRCDAPLGALEAMTVPAPTARCALEGALIDLLAQQQERPLCGLMAAGTAAASLPVNALISGTLAEVRTQAANLVGVGFTCFKLKVGAGPVGADLERVYALRSAIGSQARLRVDANGAWSREQAHEFAIEAADAGLEFCEQPLPAGDIEGLVALRRSTGLRIAVDEGVRTALDIGRIATAQAADAVVLKPMLLGGWRPTKQACALARTCGLGVVITTAMDGAIGRAHATHAAAALRLQDTAHGLATGVLLAADLTTQPLTVQSGFIHLPRAPGLGIGVLKS